MILGVPLVPDALSITWDDVARAADALGLDPDRLRDTRQIIVTANYGVVRVERYRAGDRRLTETVEVRIGQPIEEGER